MAIPGHEGDPAPSCSGMPIPTVAGVVTSLIWCAYQLMKIIYYFPVFYFCAVPLSWLMFYAGFSLLYLRRGFICWACCFTGEVRFLPCSVT